MPEMDNSQLREIDAQYVPFSPFSEGWSAIAINHEGWSHRRSELAASREKAGLDAFRRIIESVVRTAAFETGAVEGLYETDRGFTFTVASQAASWGTTLRTEKGEYTRRLFDAQLSGYEIVLDAATAQTPISEVWLRQLHEVTCSAQDTYTVVTKAGDQQQALPKGKYKEHPNHVQTLDGEIHAHAPVGDTPAEMHRLIEELRTSEFVAAHPCVQASYAHHALTAIHPFADGNGRVARALASVFLYRSDSIPFVVFSDQRQVYFRALSAADRGDPGPFCRFVYRSAVETMDSIGIQVKTASVPTPKEAARSLRRAVTTHLDITYEELNSAGRLLARLATQALTNEIKELRRTGELPPGITVNVTQGESSNPPSEDYRPPGGQNALVCQIVAAAPAAVATSYPFAVYVAKRAGSGGDVWLVSGSGLDASLDFDYQTIDPMSESTSERMKNWAEFVIACGFGHLTLLADEELKSKGLR